MSIMSRYTYKMLRWRYPSLPRWRYSPLYPSGSHRSAWIALLGAVVVAALLSAGTASFYAIEKHWPWQSASSALYDGGVLGDGYSEQPYNVNPATKLFDPGWINTGIPGAATFFLVNDSAGPGGQQYRLTLQWSTPNPSAGIAAYQLWWQWGSLSHFGSIFAFLGNDNGNTNNIVPFGQNTFTMTPAPQKYTRCTTCVLNSDDACVQIYVTSCRNSTFCGLRPSSNQAMSTAMACYNPSLIYGYHGCCSECAGYCPRYNASNPPPASVPF